MCYHVIVILSLINLGFSSAKIPFRNSPWGIRVIQSKQFKPLTILKGGYSDAVQEKGTTAALLESNENGTSAIESVTANENDSGNNSSTVEDEEAPPSWVFTCCKHGDGSESDPDGLPRRFLKMQKYNREKAIHALNSTLTWRDNHDVDTILQRPHSVFDVCKRVAPHYFGGRDPSNHIIFIQRPGLLDLNVAHANNVTVDELLMHYVYVLEYCWNIAAPLHDETMTSVLDLTGINFGIVTKGEMINFIKRFVNMMSHHYPSRSYKTLLINTPRWFGAIYKLISPLLRESTRAKIRICSRGKKQDRILKDLLGPENVPTELLFEKPKGGENTESHSCQDTEMEREFRSFCVARLDEAGSEMKAVV